METPNVPPPPPLSPVTKMKRPLGRGHYGLVRRCVDNTTGEAFAIKSIRKSRVSRVENLLREVQILRRVSHPNIIELRDVYEDETNVHLVSFRSEGSNTSGTLNTTPHVTVPFNTTPHVTVLS